MLGGTLRIGLDSSFLYKISKKYKLITVFNDFSAFESLNNMNYFHYGKKLIIHFTYSQKIKFI